MASNFISHTATFHETAFKDILDKDCEFTINVMVGSIFKEKNLKNSKILWEKANM